MPHDNVTRCVPLPVFRVLLLSPHVEASVSTVQIPQLETLACQGSCGSCCDFQCPWLIPVAGPISQWQA